MCEINWNRMSRKLLSNFPAGPLDRYRKQASFDWKKLKIYIDTEELIEYADTIIEFFKSNPLLHPVPDSLLTLDEKRRLTAKRVLALRKLQLYGVENIIGNVGKLAMMHRILFCWDPASIIKLVISDGMCVSVIRSLGTDRHYQYIDALNDGAIFCFCLTEIAHGSNIKCMRTTATYEPETEQFVLNTSDFEAAKCWVGNLAKIASHGIVFAQLYTPDGVCHGLHQFIVDIRNLQTMQPYAGLIIGDMGAKGSLNGIDNGFIMFENYRIPRENLLNKTSDVTVDGKYVTVLKDPLKRFGISLGVLSSGRVLITNIGTTYFEKALTIAIRYAAVRKQFGPDEKEELPILEYQLHQWRLLPYLGASYVFRVLCNFFSATDVQFQIDSVLSENKDALADLGMEIHAMSSSAKPVIGWIVRDGIQECREACGGHGYLEVSELCTLRNDHDGNCTYDGENHVLCQQTSNWLLKFWPCVLRNEQIPKTPLGSIDFLNNAKTILQTRFTVTTVAEITEPNHILKAYEWLVCFLLKESYEKLEKFKLQGIDGFTAKNNTQIFYLRSLAIVYIEHFMIKHMYQFAQNAPDPASKQVLLKTLQLYGVWSLDKHMPVLYQGGYAVDPEKAQLVKQSILNLCEVLKSDAMSLVDVIAPPDFLMTSPLGASDGQVYKHLESALINSPGALSRPSWWQEVASYKSKL